MTTNIVLDQTQVFAEDLPDHAGQIERYEAAGLSRPEAFTLEVHAAKIISTGRRTIIEVGQELLAARQVAQYGTWGPFLSRCGVEERTARNYMSVAERFGEQPEIISALPITALYELAAPSADPAVVGEIIAEARAGSAPSVQEIKRRLSPPPALPTLPQDLIDGGWRIRPYGTSGDQYDMVNERGGHAVSPGTVQAVIEKARALDAKLAEPPVVSPAPAPAAPPVLTPRPATPPPAPTKADDAEEEIAQAAPSQAPPTLTPLTPPSQPSPLAAVAADLTVQARKLLVSKRALLAAALSLIEAELERTTTPTTPIVVISQERAIEAARLFVSSPALGGQAAMLAFSAAVEEVAA